MVVTSKDRNIYIEISKKHLQYSVFTALFHSFREGRKEIQTENISSKWQQNERSSETTALVKILCVCLKAMVSQKVLAVLFCPLVYLSVCCSVCLLKKSFLSVSPLQAGSSQVPHPTCSWKIPVSWGTRLAGSCFVLLSYRFVVLLFRTFLSVLKSRDGSCWILVVTSHCGNGSASWPNAQKNKI